MHISRITIENIRAIERLELDLSRPWGAPRRRVILLGANGSGKTTILNAISHMFSRHADIGWPADGDERREPTRLDAGDVRRGAGGDESLSSTPVGTIDVGTFMTADEQNDIARRFNDTLPADQTWRETIRHHPRRFTFDDWLAMQGEYADDAETVEEDDRREDIRKRILVSALLHRARQPLCVLLPADRGALVPTDEVDSDSLSGFDPRAGALSSHRARFDTIPSRLALAFAAPTRNDPDGVITRMWKVMGKYFPDMPRPVDIDGLRLLFETEGGTVVTLPKLSDGQRAVLLILGELALRNPANGVVLIDEIEQHLHPRWQRAILDALISLLPSTQFIVTSQAPYIAASAPDDVVTIGDWERDGVD